VGGSGTPQFTLHCTSLNLPAFTRGSTRDYSSVIHQHEIVRVLPFASPSSLFCVGDACGGGSWNACRYLLRLYASTERLTRRPSSLH